MIDLGNENLIPIKKEPNRVSTNDIADVFGYIHTQLGDDSDNPIVLYSSSAVLLYKQEVGSAELPTDIDAFTTSQGFERLLNLITENKDNQFRDLKVEEIPMTFDAKYQEMQIRKASVFVKINGKDIELDIFSSIHDDGSVAGVEDRVNIRDDLNSVPVQSSGRDQVNIKVFKHEALVDIYRFLFQREQELSSMGYPVGELKDRLDRMRRVQVAGSIRVR